MAIVPMYRRTERDRPTHQQGFGGRTMTALTDIRTDGGTQARSSLYQNIVDDYAAAMGEGATFPPVVVFYDGENYWLADGFHRHAAAKQLGLVEIDADVRQGTRREAILYSVGTNEAHGLRRTNEDKRRSVLTLLNDEEWCKWSDREIARQCKVGAPLVGRLRSSLTVTNYSEPRTYTTKHGTTATMNTAAIGKPAIVPEAPVRPYDPHQEQEIRRAYREIEAAEPEGNVISLDADNHVRGTFGTGENEWYTPTKHLDAARVVMGGFDLDPASSEFANRAVRAAKIFTLADDGLAQEWHGRVWLNPPYAQPAIAHFADKMVAEYQAGRVTQAIVLTHNYTDTAWFQKLAHACSAICFTRGRVRFVSPTGELASPTQGQCFHYFGNDVEPFREAFSEIGFTLPVIRSLVAFPAAEQALGVR